MKNVAVKLDCKHAEENVESLLAKLAVADAEIARMKIEFDKFDGGSGWVTPSTTFSKSEADKEGQASRHGIESAKAQHNIEVEDLKACLVSPEEVVQDQDNSIRMLEGKKGEYCSGVESCD